MMRLKSKTFLESAGGFDERCASSMELVSSLNNFNFPPQTPTSTLSLQLPNKQDIVVLLNIYSPPTKDTRYCVTLASLFVDARVEIYHINFLLALKLKLNSLNNLISLWIFFNMDIGHTWTFEMQGVAKIFKILSCHCYIKCPFLGLGASFGQFSSNGISFHHELIFAMGLEF